MKKYLLSIALLSYGICCADYERDAQEWLNTYITNANGDVRIQPDQLQLIANLLYFSYLRSQTTVTIQPLAMRALTGLWCGWHNIISTRLNPSKQIPHPLCSRQEERANQDFWRAYRDHRYAARTYAHTVNTVIQANLLSDYALVAVKDFRDKAQKIITVALVDLKQHLTNLLFPQKTSNTHEPSRGPLAQFIMTYASHVAQQSYIDANNLIMVASNESWDVFSKIQEISNYTWHITEQARAAFYRALYKKLYQFMTEHAVDKKYMLILFNDAGFIPENERDMVLPEL